MSEKRSPRRKSPKKRTKDDEKRHKLISFSSQLRYLLCAILRHLRRSPVPGTVRRYVFCSSTTADVSFVRTSQLLPALGHFGLEGDLPSAPRRELRPEAALLGDVADVPAVSQRQHDRRLGPRSRKYKQKQKVTIVLGCHHRRSSALRMKAVS